MTLCRAPHLFVTGSRRYSERAQLASRSATESLRPRLQWLLWAAPVAPGGWLYDSTLDTFAEPHFMWEPENGCTIFFVSGSMRTSSCGSILAVLQVAFQEQSMDILWFPTCAKNELWKTASKENIPFVELSNYQLQYYPRWYPISARHIPFCFEHLRVKASCDGCRFQASTIVVGAYSRFRGDILWPCLVVSPTCSCCLIKS